jgi:hypothetical protein
MEHGGARPGAGRPSKTSNVLKGEAVVQRRLRGGAELGWEALADEYPSIMRAAIELALGNEDNKPDKSMLKTLIELMPKVVGVEQDTEDSPITKMLRELHVRITAETKSTD